MSNAPLNMLERMGKRSKAVGQLVCRYPHVLLVPLAVLGLLLGLGIWGVRNAQDNIIDQNRQSAEYHALSTAQDVHADMSQADLPLQQLAQLARTYTNIPNYLRMWDAVINSTWKGVPPGTVGLTLVNMGIFQRNYVSPDFHSDVSGSMATLGMDIMNPNSPYYPAMLAALRAGKITIQGPYPDPASKRMITSVVLPVYMQGVPANETWGLTYDFSQCPAGLCYNTTTRTKVWGTIGMTIDFSQWLEEREPMKSLANDGYKVLMLRPGVSQLAEPAEVAMYASSNASAAPSDSIRVPVMVLQQQWTLVVWSDSGWGAHLKYLYAIVVVGSVVISSLIFAVLLAWVENRAILYSVLPKHTINRIRDEAEWTTLQSEDFHNIQLETPARHMLAIISACLDQQWPSLQLLLSVRDALSRTADVYRPTAADFKDKLQASDAVDAEVRQALVAQLIGDSPEAGPAGTILAHPMAQRAHPPSLLQSLNTSKISLVVPATIPHSRVVSLERATQPGATAGTSIFHNMLAAPMAGSNETVCLSLPDIANLPTGSLPQLHAALVALMGHSGAWQGSAVWPEAARPQRISCQQATLEEPPRATSNGGTDRPVNYTTMTSADLRITSFGASASPAIPEQPLWTQLEVILGGVNTWAFDSFALEEASCGHPLSVLGYYLISQTGLAHWANMDVAKLIRFLQAVEDGYPVTNPYHNKRHAAEVLQAMHMIVTQGGLTPGFVDEGAQLACYLSAIIHDFEHRGRNNDYLVNAHDELAVRYNDKSPMENHHLAAAWGLLRKPELNCLSDVPKATWLKLRKLMIDLVLATDMKQHFAILGQFETMHQATASNHDKPSSSGHEGQSHPGHVDSTSTSSTQHNMSGRTSFSTHIVPISDNDRTLSLQMALKCADLANLAAPLHVYLRWVRCLEEELFQQGDDERAQGLALSPLCDRTKAGVSKSQVGFLEFVAIPLFRAYTSRFTSASALMTSLTNNYKYWQMSAVLASRSSTNSAKEEGPKAGRTSGRSDAVGSGDSTHDV